MKIVGLCGGSGSGKGAVSSLFIKRGIPSIDTDAVYRELTLGDSECIRSLALAFGNEIISDDGSLNRKALRKIVFESEEAEIKLKILNQITHKFILDETRRRLEDYKAKGVKAAIVDAPVLFESGFDQECDVIVSVVADREVRINRIMLRDNIGRNDAILRISSQLSDEEIIERSDIVIFNNSDISDLDKRVGEVAGFILNN